MKNLFNKDKKRAITVTTIFGCISIAVVLISLNTGTLSIAPFKVIQTLFGYGDFESATVLYDYRMPRIIITMLAGIGLGVSGANPQSCVPAKLAIVISLSVVDVEKLAGIIGSGRRVQRPHPGVEHIVSGDRLAS